MKRPERPEALFAVLVVVVALLLPGGIANAASTANGDALSPARAKAAGAGKSKAASSPKDATKIRAKLSDLSDAYKQSADTIGMLDNRRVKLGKQIKATKKKLSDSRTKVAQAAQEAYTSGSADSTVVALTSQVGPNETVQRITTLTVLNEGNDTAIKDAQRARKKLAVQRASLTKAIKRAKSEQATLESKRSKLNAALLEAARAAAKRANGKASRSPKLKNGGACPVGSPYTVMDTFGAARGGGRAHEGDDIPAPKGTPIYAVEDGTISRAYSNTLGGIAIILKGKSGDSYYYAHQEQNLVHTGAKVVAGQQIAKVGMTGDAQGTIFHLHFERWPGGGNAVDPYPFVTALCGKKG